MIARKPISNPFINRILLIQTEATFYHTLVSKDQLATSKEYESKLLRYGDVLDS